MQVDQPNIFDGQGKFDLSKQQNKYDIDNMVSIPFYPGNGRKHCNSIDISSWQNKANIAVPKSKLIAAADQSVPIEDRDTMLSFTVNQQDILSEEELTDDEIYLERHEKAFSEFMNKSFTFNKKK